ncbi:MAG: hypothetical protein NC040_07170, partial [Muribaculaceae bacterium]|nr:hypothetical protein [Muribaculaceae bacterium]
MAVIGAESVTENQKLHSERITDMRELFVIDLKDYDLELKRFRRPSVRGIIFKDKKIDRMEKEEYVVRFLALYQDFEKYNGSINKFINLHLEGKRPLEKIDSEKFDEATKGSIKAFKKAIDANIEVFGINAFKNCIEYKGAKNKLNIMYKTLSKPVFDMQMLGFTDFDLDLIIRHKEAIKNKYEELILNKEEMKPYYKNMSKKSVNYRISEWKKEIS